MPVHKTYPIEKSFFYRQRSIEKVCKVLGITRPQFEALAVPSADHFRTKEKNENNKRRTETPVGLMRMVHDRLQVLLYRISVPPYAAALRRDISYADNAKSHARRYVLKTDIAGFYPSVKTHHVFNFLTKTLQMERDLAGRLSKIMTVTGFVPTGSPLSQTISFWALYPTFEKVAALALENGIHFTVWVDDLVFSSDNVIPHQFLGSVAKLLKAAGMKPKYSKTKSYKPTQAKRITGAINNRANETRVPNRWRREIIEIVRKIKNDKVVPEETRQKLISKISAAQMIESGAFKSTRAKAMHLSVVRESRPTAKRSKVKRSYPKIF